MTGLLQDIAALASIAIFTAGVAVASIALTPCEFEDSSNCAWNAETQGNGRGRSFVNVAGLVVRFQEPAASQLTVKSEDF